MKFTQEELKKIMLDREEIVRRNPELKRLFDLKVNRAAKKAPKYKNKKTEHAGQTFDSRGEANMYDFLLLAEKAGELRDIRRQHTVYLTEARIGYRADFRVFDIKLEQYVWVEFKGFDTPEWMLKKKLWGVYGPGPLRIFKAGKPYPSLVTTVFPTRPRVQY